MNRQLIAEVRAHALANYDAGGWDVIVEAWDDEQIADAIGGARTLNGALRKLRPVIDVYADRQADARVEGATDVPPPPEPEPEPGCTWLVPYPAYWVTFDEETGEGDWMDAGVEDCGAPVTETDRGWTCARGHGHVYAEVRYAEGWDYAEDAGEAELLARAGTEPRDLVTGGPF